MIHENELFKARNINLIHNYLSEGGVVTIQKHKHYKILHKLDERLNQIILPTNKIDMLIDWWNETIRCEVDIPHTFDSGYLIIENEYLDKTYYRDDLREIAKLFKSNIYGLDEHYKKFIKNKYTTTIYFKFIDGNKIHVEIYDNNKGIFSRVIITYGESSKSMKMYEEKIIDTPKDFNLIQENLMNSINKFNINILITVLWYIATSSKSTKYIYEVAKPKNNYEIKNVVDVRDTKVITSTIYDLSKAKKVTTNVLNRRKAGWTYSHSFEVHGHYRHYKNGKVIFINPFIKGKNKPLKNQKIILNPKEGE